MSDPLHAVTCIARGLPPQVALLVGGAAAQSHVEALEAHGARVLGDIPVLRRVLRALRASTRVRPGETGD